MPITQHPRGLFIHLTPWHWLDYTQNDLSPVPFIDHENPADISLQSHDKTSVAFPQFLQLPYGMSIYFRGKGLGVTAPNFRAILCDNKLDPGYCTLEPDC
jgi:hypothetical protein